MKKVLLFCFLIAASVNSFAFLSQSHWRWRKDNGSQITATWVAPEDSSAKIFNTSEALRLRISFFNNDSVNTEEMNNAELNYSSDEGITWTKITRGVAGDNIHFILAGDSPNCKDGDSTTQQLTGVTGFTFEKGKIITSTDQLAAHVVPIRRRTEYEWLLKPTSFILPNKHYIFQLIATTTDFVGHTFPSLTTSNVLLTSSISASTCSGVPFLYAATTNASGASISWSRAAVTGISNTAKTGTTANISDTLINTTSSAIDVNYVYYLNGPTDATQTQNVVVTVNPKPTKPVISWSGSNLSTTSTGPNYQWLLSNAAVSLATTSSYKPAAIGSYKVQVSSLQGCISISDSFNLLITALQNPISSTGSFNAKLSPNPASSDLMIKFAEQPTSTLFIQLISTDGHVIKSFRTKDKMKVMSVSDVLPGNYFIRIIGKNYDQTQKLLINNNK
jgi:hypothetical protein